MPRGYPLRSGVGPSKGGGVDCVRLEKAVDGLKQVPREWNSTFAVYLIQLGFKRLYSDIYVLTNGEGEDHYHFGSCV